MRTHRRTRRPEGGVSLVELAIVLAVAGILYALGTAVFVSASERARAFGAARHVAGILAQARLEALGRGVTVGYRFVPSDGDYACRKYEDGNGNGLRTDDITTGTDRPLGPEERLDHHFAGTRFGIAFPLPPVDGEGSMLPTGSDPIRIGSTALLSFSPHGTGSSGTLYLVGPGPRQFAVRLLGVTGRVRVFEFQPGTGAWAQP